MHRVDPDDLLRQLAEIEERPGDRPADDVLRAFAAGELAEEEELRVAAAIAGNPAARERLAEIVGVALPRPGEATRRKVLAGEGAQQPARRGVRHPRLGWGLAAAAVLAAALGWSLFQDHFRPARSLTDDYTVQVEGLKEDRSATPTAPTTTEDRTTAAADPGTPVSVTILRTGFDDDPRYSLYRLAGNRLELLPISFSGSPKVVSIDRPASELLPPGAERTELFAVVAQAGDKLPESLPVTAGQSPEAALGEGPTRKVFRLSIVPP